MPAKNAETESDFADVATEYEKALLIAPWSAADYFKFDPASLFGGYKESGFGREGGLHGLSAYCRRD